jgi:hypothetical protein
VDGAAATPAGGDARPNQNVDSPISLVIDTVEGRY